MATNPVNLVDAIGTVVPRLARARTATIRFGSVKTAASAGVVTVTVAGVDLPCNYVSSGLVFRVGDWVAIVNDGDRWVVLGKVVPASGVVVNDILLGDPASGAVGAFAADRLIDGHVIHIALYATANSGNGAGLQVYLDGVLKSLLVVDQFAQLTVMDGGGTYRPLPWAMEVDFLTLPINGKTTASVTTTFTLNRFTFAPIITESLYTGSGSAATVGQLRHHTLSKDAVTFSHNQTATATADYTVHYHAIQMYSTTAAGRRDRPIPQPTGSNDVETHPVTLTCDTVGCENFGAPIETPVPLDVDRIQCGPCSREITDIDLAPKGG